MTKELSNYLTKIDEVLKRLEIKIESYEMLNPKISAVNVGWHIEHSLMVFDEYIDFLTNSNPKNYKGKFNFIKLIVLATKFIPRKYGKSPKNMLPKDVIQIDKNRLITHLAETKQKIKKLETLPKDKYVDHPVFGQLTLMQTIDYTVTHTKHHLKIINDIESK